MSKSLASITTPGGISANSKNPFDKMVVARDAKLKPGEDPTALMQGKGLSSMFDKGIDEQLKIFMKMITVMAQNPDPTEGSDMTKMLDKFMSFFGTATQMKSNQLIEKGNALQVTNQQLAAEAHLGKEVEYVGDTFTYDGTTPENIHFLMPAKMKEAKLMILNENNLLVKEINLSTQEGPRNELWDGTDNRDGKVGKGNYQARIVGVDAAKQQHAMPTRFTGIVTDIQYLDDGAFIYRVKDTPVNFEELEFVRKNPNTKMQPFIDVIDTNVKELMALRKAYEGAQLDIPTSSSETINELGEAIGEAVNLINTTGEGGGHLAEQMAQNLNLVENGLQA